MSLRDPRRRLFFVLKGQGSSARGTVFQVPRVSTDCYKGSLKGNSNGAISLQDHLHIVFSTKGRYPYLTDPQTRAEMHGYLAGAFNDEKCPAIEVGGSTDHTHVLCQLARTITVAELLRRTKRSSSVWIKDKGGLLQKFDWQDGYGAFSIGQSQVKQVRRYVLAQDRHHQRVSFQDEFRQFLKRYEIEYDERYVWD